MSIGCYLKYNNPDHPEYKTWLSQRRQRFVKILREGKRICKLSEIERQEVIKLCKLIETGTRELL